MTVRELIDELQNFDGDTEVRFSYDYGDHWHTEVAIEVEHVELTPVTYSSYHEKMRVVDPDKMEEAECDAEEEGVENTKVKRVVVLN